MIVQRTSGLFLVASLAILAALGCGSDRTTPQCPANAPTSGAACTSEGLACTFMSCSTFGVTSATCQTGAWQVTTTACAPTPCSTYLGSMQCPAGQLCVERRGGADLFNCEPNPCPDGGTIECACVCGGNCMAPSSGTRWTCNTCPGGGCP